MRSMIWFKKAGGPSTGAMLLLALLVALLSVLVGFVSVPTAAATWLIRHLGYYFIFLVVGLFVHATYRVSVCDGLSPTRAWRTSRKGWIVVGACSLLVLAMDRFAYKVLFDEYVLQGTAQYMHLTKEVGALVRGYHLSGSFIPLDAMLDKRPYLQPFLISLVHDFTGYRPLNMFLLNAALVPVLLGLVYYIGRKLCNELGGIVAVLLLSTLPLLGQVATGAGMEMLNLTMLVLLVAAAIRYVSAPSEERLALLCVCAVMMSQCRYESVLFAVPAGLCVLWGWWRVRRILLPWMALVTPLLFVPYAWHNRILSESPLLWQLQEGQSSRFSVQYVAENIKGAWQFFFSPEQNLASSPMLTWGGVLCLVLFPIAWRRLRQGGEVSALKVSGLFALFIIGNLGLLMFYYWARLDDPVASRFALPICVALAVFESVVLASLLKERRAWQVAACLVYGVYLMGVLRPSMAHAYYTELNQSARMVEWDVAYVNSLPPRPRLIVANRSSLPFTIEEQPAMRLVGLGASLEKVRFHLNAGTFNEVLVLQTLRPASEEGDYYLDPEDKLPEGCELELLAEKRFGATLHRISRLILKDPREEAAGS